MILIRPLIWAWCSLLPSRLVDATGMRKIRYCIWSHFFFVLISLLRCCLQYCFAVPDILFLVYFSSNKPTRCNNFSNLFLEWNSKCFGHFLCPSSGVFHSTHSNDICQQTCMSYTIAVCTVKNSWRLTEEPSETCRISFQE